MRFSGDWCGLQFFLLADQFKQRRDLFEQARQVRDDFGGAAGADQR
jgi:hypothetical protein